MLNEIKKALCYKNGEFSITRTILVSASILVLVLYSFLSLFQGSILLGWWVVPIFSPGAATAVLGSLAALYTVNHGWVNKEGTKGEQFQQIREEINKISAAIKGNSEE